MKFSKCKAKLRLVEIIYFYKSSSNLYSQILSYKRYIF